MNGLNKKIAIFRELLLRLPGEVNLTKPEFPLVIFEDGDVAAGETLRQVKRIILIMGEY